MPSCRKRTSAARALCTAILLLAPAFAHPQESLRLTELSLEELMDIEISSVSRKTEKVAAAAAAIAVITAEEIRRSGATTLAEALRLAPGLHVARIDASKWAIASRGFNNHFVGHLLVLIDGRSVYSPLFSGVFWEIQNLPLEDVEQIEVIRGPGATMWGANAVNGIINIITRNARETQGGLLKAGLGTEERGFGNLRYGAPLGESGYYRAHVKYFDRAPLVDSAGTKAADAWSALQGGFRLDWEAGEDDTAILQGGLYKVEADETLSIPYLLPPHVLVVEDQRNYAGGHLQGRWRHALSGGAELALQIYFDRSEVEGAGMHQDGPFRELRHTLDVDTQYQFALAGSHEIIWGLGYRSTRDKIANIADLALDPPRRSDQLFSAFVQDEIALSPERLYLSAGSKFEHNDYTGFEFQPNLRLLLRPHPRQSVWAALSRAVRTPNRIESDVRLLGNVIPPNSRVNPGDLPIRVVLQGDKEVEAENLLAWELGYRAEVARGISVDLASFYHAYDDLRTVELATAYLDTTATIPHIDLPFKGKGKMEGESYGIETVVEVRPSPGWQVEATYTYLQMELRLDEDSRDLGSDALADESPDHQWALRSAVDLHPNLELYLGLRYVDELNGLDVGSYADLDARLEWRVFPGLTFSLVGRNLLDDHHLEFSKQALINTQSSEIEREVYGTCTWNFGSGGP